MAYDPLSDVIDELLSISSEEICQFEAFLASEKFPEEPYVEFEEIGL